jgi:hypothetical protein
MVKVEDLRPREMPTVPEVRQYLKDAQKHEKDADFLATEIFREIYEKVQSANCAHLFTTAQLERYAQQFARYIQLEQLVSKYGFMATDRKGNIVAIPLEALRQSNLKILNGMDEDINRVLRENGGGLTVATDRMAAVMARAQSLAS